MSYITVTLINVDTSLNFDSYTVRDNNNNNSSFRVENLRGGDSYPFQCVADAQDWGNVSVKRDDEAIWTDYSILHDGDDIRQ